MVLLYILLLVSGHHGQVTFNGVPVPGATVTVVQTDKTFTSITDQEGLYSFPQLAEGSFTVQVEMLGFSTIKQEVNTETSVFELKMLPVEEIHAEVAHGGIIEQRTEVNAAPPSASQAPK